MENKLLLNYQNDTLEVSPNYDNDNGDWESSIGQVEPIYIQITEQGFEDGSVCMGLTLEHATELRDFLSEKIDYLTKNQ